MIRSAVDRYLAIRRLSGLKLDGTARNLYAFAQVAEERGEEFIRESMVIEWARSSTSSQEIRRVRLLEVAQLARFLHLEDSRHEIPSPERFFSRRSRPTPYIYTPDEIRRLVAWAGQVHPTYPHRRAVHQTIFGLIAATGLRRSEALNLRFRDVLPGGVLQVERTKFRKSRLIPLHPTVVDQLERYLELRCRLKVEDEHLFVGESGKQLSADSLNAVFPWILRAAKIAPQGARRPRIHDLRHTFATRVLQQCATNRDSVASQFVALSTYLGHVDAGSTYWYLEATPELMQDISSAAEEFRAGRHS